MTSSDGDHLVRVATSGGVRTLTLDSPHNRNALSTGLMRQLLAALAEAISDDSVRVVVLSHTGPVFCSGVDLRETAEVTAAAALSSAKADQNRPPAATGGLPASVTPAEMLADVITACWECPKPLVARIGGPARAGGLGLVAAADIAVCVEDATFAFTEVRLGVIPAVISATVLRRLTPRAAAELYLTGDVFDGRRAAQIGLVTAAAPAQALDATVAVYCDALVRGGPNAVAGTKDLLRRPLAATVREDLMKLSALSVGYFHSEEGREGVQAYREKRPANWVPRP
jgi:methylglutaconyl-CoA hydratase